MRGARGDTRSYRNPVGVCCPECGSLNVQERPTCKPQPYRCRDCRKDFSVKTGTLMHNSKLGLQTWAIALYLLSTGLQRTSSMKIHRDLGVTQKTAGSSRIASARHGARGASRSPARWKWTRSTAATRSGTSTSRRS